MKEKKKFSEILLIIILLAAIALCWTVFKGRALDPSTLKFIYQDF